MASKAVIQTIAITAQIYGKEFSEDAARVFAGDLDGFPEQAILTAIAKCRRELRFFPTVADILSRIEDGRPGSDEAWAMLPKSEADSVVWTAEMREAYGIVRGLIGDDQVAARMAFKEAYTRRVQEAREKNIAPVWEPSLGHDKRTHAAVLNRALEKGLLPASQVRALLPEPQPTNLVLIEGDKDEGLSTVDFQAMLAKIKERIKNPKEGA
jgi:hypothetical protein